MMSDIMIVEGEGETNPRIDSVTLKPGMGFIPQVAIDQHFAQRGRLGRFVSALMQQPAVLGFGIDENTAIAVANSFLISLLLIVLRILQILPRDILGARSISK